MKPPAKLHNKTGRLKNINKSYTNPIQGTTTPSNTANTTTTTAPPNVTATNNGLDAVAIEQFELELCWCIQTLEKSLELNKLNAKQVQDVEKTIRLLKSSNQPLVKKRQIMQTTLGNYRKKMQEEEKKLRAGNSAIQFIVDTNENDKSTAPKSGAITNSKGHFVKKSFAASLGDARFQFNFPVDAIEKLSLDASNETNVRVAQPPENTSQAENTSVKEKQTKNAVDTTSKVQLGPFAKTKLESSDNSFKFNFAIE